MNIYDNMEPWELLFLINNTDNKSEILSMISVDNPFWTGISLVINPYIGKIFKLPLSNIKKYGTGVDCRVFFNIVKVIQNGTLSGDNLVLTIEKFIQCCSRPEWEEWYRKILDDTLEVRIPLVLYNKYCPLDYHIYRPQLPLYESIPESRELVYYPCIVQPVYDGTRSFWFIDTTELIVEIRGYTYDGMRYHNAQLEEHLYELSKKSMKVVVFGTISNNNFIIDDIITYEQFLNESTTAILRNRLSGLFLLKDLGFNIAQISHEITMREQLDAEVSLIREQGYSNVVVRNPLLDYWS